MIRNLQFAHPVEWDNDRTYNADEVVFYENNAYTAKQHVPSGTSLEESDYWVKTADKDWIAGIAEQPISQTEE